jgi:hypothetical protein
MHSTAGAKRDGKIGTGYFRYILRHNDRYSIIKTRYTPVQISRQNIDFGRAGVYFTSRANNKTETGNAMEEPTLTDQLPLGRLSSAARSALCPILPQLYSAN